MSRAMWDGAWLTLTFTALWFAHDPTLPLACGLAWALGRLEGAH